MGKDPQSTLDRKTSAELSEIARGIVANEIFTDRHIAPGDERLLPIVFAPLGFLDRKQVLELQRKQRPGMMFAKMAQAGPRAINGYPMFFELTLLHPEDAKIVWDQVKALQWHLDNP